MIHTFIPYAHKNENKNIGKVYNRYMNMIGDNDWALFLDADAMFTTPDYHSQIEIIVKEIEEKDLKIGLLTSSTNRIGNIEQIIFSKDSKEAYNHSIDFHRKIGKEIQEKERYNIQECKDPISGVVLLISKEAWKETIGFMDGFLGVDNDIDYKIRRAGYRTCIMCGVYVYHWYRSDWKEIGGFKPTGYN